MTERNVKAPYKTKSESDRDVITGQVSVINNYRNKLAEANEIIEQLQADKEYLNQRNNMLETKNKYLYTALNGDPQHD